MTDIMRAIQLLKEGHKIRRLSWYAGSYLVLDNDRIVNNHGDSVKFDHIGSLEANDWEVYVDKPTLVSDALRIEIAVMHNGKLELRIGDLSGSSTSSNITLNEALIDISDEIKRLMLEEKK